jgi:hypothetical protein
MRPGGIAAFEEADACSALAAPPDLLAVFDFLLPIVCCVDTVDLKYLKKSD